MRDWYYEFSNDEGRLTTKCVKYNDVVRDPRIAMARAVMAGKFGNGKFRVDKLRSLGYSPQEIHEIQLTVNWMMDLRLK